MRSFTHILSKLIIIKKISIIRQPPPENYKNSALLFSENLQLRNEPYSILTDNSDFIVVGVIGPQGTGMANKILFIRAQNSKKI